MSTQIISQIIWICIAIVYSHFFQLISLELISKWMPTSVFIFISEHYSLFLFVLNCIFTIITMGIVFCNVKFVSTLYIIISEINKSIEWENAHSVDTIFCFPYQLNEDLYTMTSYTIHYTNTTSNCPWKRIHASNKCSKYFYLIASPKWYSF